MNNWEAVGYIFSWFGMVFLVVTFSVGLLEESGLSILSTTSLFYTKTSSAMLPWVFISALCWVVAIVGLTAGAKQKGNIKSKLSRLIIVVDSFVKAFKHTFRLRC